MPMSSATGISWGRSVLARPAAGPGAEGAVEGGGVGKAEVGADAAQRPRRLGQPFDGQFAAQAVLDGAKTGAFVLQPAVQGARREEQALGQRRQRQVLGQGGAQVFAHAQGQRAVAAVQRGDAGRRVGEEARQRRLVAAHRQRQPLGRKARLQARRIEGVARGEDQFVVGHVQRRRVGES
jgi:hypothetical protein